MLLYISHEKLEKPLLKGTFWPPSNYLHFILVLKGPKIEDISFYNNEQLYNCDPHSFPIKNMSGNIEK